MSVRPLPDPVLEAVAAYRYTVEELISVLSNQRSACEIAAAYSVENGDAALPAANAAVNHATPKPIAPDGLSVDDSVVADPGPERTSRPEAPPSFEGDTTRYAWAYREEGGIGALGPADPADFEEPPDLDTEPATATGGGKR